jgi:hypothetical protein
LILLRISRKPDRRFFFKSRDFIPTAKSRRLTADYLWPDLKKAKKAKKSTVEIEDDADFEADFQELNKTGIEFVNEVRSPIHFA